MNKILFIAARNITQTSRKYLLFGTNPLNYSMNNLYHFQQLDNK